MIVADLNKYLEAKIIFENELEYFQEQLKKPIYTSEDAYETTKEWLDNLEVALEAINIVLQDKNKIALIAACNFIAEILKSDCPADYFKSNDILGVPCTVICHKGNSDNYKCWMRYFSNKEAENGSN